MKCIIIDDEPLAREGMKLHIDDSKNLELIADFDNTSEALEYIKKNDVDLMFLDVEMPGQTGIDFLKSLSNPPLTILATAYTDYALDGYELNVVDYLVKPVKSDRFQKAIEKAQHLFELENNGLAKNESQEDHIYLKSDRKFVKVMLEEIKFIKGMKDYVMVYTDDNKLMTAMNIKTIFNQLDQSRFARVSKSYIINVGRIDEVKPNSLLIEGEEIPLGKTYKDDFMQDFVRNRLLER